MKIAIDATTLCTPTGGVGAGIEHYTQSLIAALLKQKPVHRFVIYPRTECSPAQLSRLMRGAAHAKVIPQWRKFLPYFSRHTLFPWQMQMEKPDVLLAPAGQLPLGWKGKSVVIKHDASIFEHPEWFEGMGDQRFSTQKVVPLSIERATKIVAISSFTKAQIDRVFPGSGSKTTVVHSGVDAVSSGGEIGARPLDRFPFDRDYVLFLGTLEPRKNLPFAIAGFHHFLQMQPDKATQVRFVLAGRPGWNTAEIDEAVEEVNARWASVEPKGVIQLLGEVTEQEKWNLLTHAASFLFPSYEEGFGLPVLEAMSVGTPVITTRQGALPEVAGDHAMFVEPEDIEGIGLAVAQSVLLPEGLELLSYEAQKHAIGFTWDKTAKGVLEVIESI